MKRISNYHSHVALCGHAEGTVEDYVKEAIKIARNLKTGKKRRVILLENDLPDNY